MWPRSLGSLLIALLACACSGAKGGGDGAPEDAARAKELQAQRERERTKVRVEPIAQREMVRKIETTTVVESEQQVAIFPRISAHVTEILVEEGDRVLPGQVLARLESEEAEIAVEDARVSLAEARASLERLEVASREAQARSDAAERAFAQAKRDHERNMAIASGVNGTTGLLSAKDLDASRLAAAQAEGEVETMKLAHQRAHLEERAGKTAIDRAELTLKQRELDLTYTEIQAPFEGVIAERSIRAGDMATPQTAAFILTDPSRLRAVFYRPQRELNLFRSVGNGAVGNGHGGHEVVGDLQLTARAEAHPGQEFRGEIQRISPTIDPQSGSFRVTANISRSSHNGSAELLPGMLVRLEIVTERHPLALVIPKRALRREGDVALIFTVHEDQARRIVVEEGFSDDKHVEVSAVGEAALAPGDLVVVVGNRDLEDGSEVELEKTDAPAEKPEPVEEQVASEEIPPDSGGEGGG